MCHDGVYMSFTRLSSELDVDVFESDSSSREVGFGSVDLTRRSSDMWRSSSLRLLKVESSRRMLLSAVRRV